MTKAKAKQLELNLNPTTDTTKGNTMTGNNTLKTEDKDIKFIAIERALTMLRAAGCVYFVEDAAGNTHSTGGLQVVKPTAKKRHANPTRPMGALINYYKPFIESVASGGYCKIPVGSFVAEDLRSAISAWCTQTWGKKTFMTHIKGTDIEVLRFE